MNKQTYKISGHHAIRLAERDGLTLHKYSDPVEGYRVVTPDEARQIAQADANLIYCIVVPVGWTDPAGGYNVADYFRGALGGLAQSGATYLGPDESGVEPIWADDRKAV